MKLMKTTKNLFLLALMLATFAGAQTTKTTAMLQNDQTFTGNNTFVIPPHLNRDPIYSYEATTKNYVDNGFVRKTYSLIGNSYISVANPSLGGSSSTISCTVASPTTGGCLTNSDYLNFSSKLSTATFGVTNSWTAPQNFTDLISKGPVADIRAFGAKCDGTDAAPALRAALASGARTIALYPCSSSSDTYTLSSFDQTDFYGQRFIAWIGSNQFIIGKGAKLKIGNGLLNSSTGRGVLMTRGTSNVGVIGVYFDMNGINNLPPNGGFYPELVLQAINATRGTFQGNTILNSAGTNVIAVGGLTTDGNSGDAWDIADNVTYTSGTQLPGNTHQVDWSAYYSEATNTVFRNNRVYGSLPQYAQPAGGIELHGNHSKAIGNYIQGSSPCMYISGVLPGSGPQYDTTDIVVDHNECDGVQYGISFFPSGSGANQNHISITNNIFRLANNTYFPAAPAVLTTGFQSDGTWPSSTRFLIQDLLFQGNRSYATGLAAANIQVLHSLNGATFTGNQYSDFPNQMYFYANPDGINKVTVKGNSFFNVGAGNYAIYVSANPGDVHLNPWAATTSYGQNQFLTPTVPNGFSYENTSGITCTSSSSQPTWPTVLGNTVADGTCVWTTRNIWTINNLDIENNVFTQTGTANIASIRLRSTVNVGTISARITGNTGFGQSVSLYPTFDTGTTVDQNVTAVTMTAGQINGTIYADQQSGSDVCAKIASAIAASPSQGGVIDARNFTGDQTCTSGTLTLGSTTKSVTLLMGNYRIISASTPVISVPGSSWIIGQNMTGGTGFSAINSTNSGGTVVLWTGSNGGMRNMFLGAVGANSRGLYLQASGTTSVQNNVFENVQMNGGAATNAGSQGARLEANSATALVSHNTFTNVWIHDFSSDLSLVTSNTVGPTDNTFTNLTLQTFGTAAGTGIAIAAGSVNNFHGGIISNVTFGIDLETPAVTSYNVFLGMRTESNTTNLTDNGTGTMFIGHSMDSTITSIAGSDATRIYTGQGAQIVTIPVSVSATAQAANITSTNLLTSAMAGMYKAYCYVIVTQAATTSSTLPSCQVTYTDNDTNIGSTQALTNTSTGNTVGTVNTAVNASGTLSVKAGTNITYSTTGYVSSGATPMQYAIRLKLEYLGN